MVDIANAFPSKYLKCSDLDDHDKEVSMRKVLFEEIGSDGNKPVLYFMDEQKGLVLNKTNAKVIAKAYGRDTDEWTGKKLVLFPTLTDFRGDQVECIRVRVPKPIKAPPQHKAATEAEPPPFDDTIEF